MAVEHAQLDPNEINFDKIQVKNLQFQSLSLTDGKKQ